MIIKLVISFFIIFCTTQIGFLLSKKYVLRLEELEELKNIFKIMENKIKYTYEPLDKIFCEISNISSNTFQTFFIEVSKNIKLKGTKKAWEDEIENLESSLTKEDKEKLRSFSKLLGKYNKEGQLNQIDFIEGLIEVQISRAKKDREKNETIYKKLGLILGVGLVIIIY